MNEELERTDRCRPKIFVAKPVIKGTRLPIEFRIESMAQKCSKDKILRNYSGLPEENINAWLAYASAVLHAERIYLLPTEPVPVLANEKLVWGHYQSPEKLRIGCPLDQNRRTRNFRRGRPYPCSEKGSSLFNIRQRSRGTRISLRTTYNQRNYLPRQVASSFIRRTEAFIAALI
ncbi:MAG: DUF433 domain-containing protein [Nitrospirota bacterium]